MISANDPVTVGFRFDRAEIGPSTNAGVRALLQQSAVGAIMSAA
jgi:hypothetical protein